MLLIMKMHCNKLGYIFAEIFVEASTGDKYDPNRSSVITWLNAYLKRRLQDGRIQEQEKLAHTASHKCN